MNKYIPLFLFILAMPSGIFSQTTPTRENLEEIARQRVVESANAPKSSTWNVNIPPPLGSIKVDREPAYRNYTAEQMVKEIFISAGNGCGIDNFVKNVQFKGTWTSGGNNSILYFSADGTAATALGMEEGILLATGPARTAEGINSSGSSISGGVSVSTDPDLRTLAVPTSGSILEFDFIPMKTPISFEYVFASEEYPEFANSNYNDVFGFFISGPGIIGGKQNIALIPGTTTPVTINNVNWGNASSNTTTGLPSPRAGANNPQYYHPNYDGASLMEFDGYTTVFTATANVIPGQTYHLKLAIANVTDTNYGSGVFLKAGSLDLGYGITGIENELGIGVDSEQGDNIYIGCSETKFVFQINPVATPTIINLAYSGDAYTNGYIKAAPTGELPNQITIPANSTSYTVYYDVLGPLNQNGLDFTITASLDICSGIEPLEKTFYVYQTLENVTPVITPSCEGANNGQITFTYDKGSSNAEMSIDNGATWREINKDGAFTNLASGTYNVWVKDKNSCHISYHNGLVVPVIPKVNAITGYNMYADCQSKFTIGLSSQVHVPVRVNLSYSANEHIKAPDGAALPAFVIIPPNTTSFDVPYKVLNTFSGNDVDFTVAASVENCSAYPLFPKNFKVYSKVQATPIVKAACTTTSNEGQITFSLVNGSPDVQMSKDGGATWINIIGQSFTGLGTGNYNIKVRDLNSCHTEDFSIEVPVAPSITEIAGHDMYESCEDEIVIKLSNSISTTLPISINYNGSAVSYITTPAGGALPTSVIIPANTSEYVIPYKVATPLAQNDGFFAVMVTLGDCSSTSVVGSFNVYKKVIAVPEVIATCGSSSTGQIGFALTGGSPNVEMKLDGNGWIKVSDGPYTGLGQGNYTVMIRDLNSCHTETFNLEVPFSPEISEITGHHIYEACTSDFIIKLNKSISTTTRVNLSYDGTAVSDVTAPGGYALPAFIVIPAGETEYAVTYKVANTVAENGRIFTVTATLPDCSSTPAVEQSFGVYKQVVATPVITLACGESASGQIDFTLLNGSPDVEMNLNGGVWKKIADGPFTGLTADTYTVQIRDLNSCHTVPFTIEVPAPPQITGIVGTELYEECSGKFEINLSHTISIPTTINLAYSGIAANDIKLPDNSSLPASIIVPANAQKIEIPYKVVANITQNGAGFTISATMTGCPGLPFNKTFPVYNKVVATPVITATCATPATGQITFTLEGGSPNVMMSKDNGATWQKIADAPFTGLAAGTYTVLVKDQNSCHQNSYNIVVPELPVISEILGHDMYAECEDEFLIRLNHAASVATVINLNYTGIAVSDITSIDGSILPSTIIVPAGNTEFQLGYKVKSAITSNGGSFTITASLDGCDYVTPVALSVNVYNIVNATPEVTVTCGSLSIGKIGFNVTGGSPNVEMSKDNGASWQKISDGQFIGLGAGTYTILVRDKNSCHTEQFEIEVPSSPVVSAISGYELYESCEDEIVIQLDREIYLPTVVNLTYTGASDITALNGSALPTTIIIPANSHEFGIQYKVADHITSNGSDFTITATLDACGTAAPFVKDFKIYSKVIATPQVTATCGDASTGKIGFSVNGGSPYVAMSIDNGNTWKEIAYGAFMNLGAGFYTVLVKDKNSCHANDEFYLEVPVSPVVQEIPVNDIFEDCDDYEFTIRLNKTVPTSTVINLAYSGSAVSNVTMPDGSALPASITIPANTIEYLIPYKVLGTDVINGGEFVITATMEDCSSTPAFSQTFIVYSKVIATPVITAACGETNTGAIAFDLEGGSENILMSNNNGVSWQDTSGSYTNLMPGSYTILIKDENSCNTETFIVEVPASPIVSSIIAVTEIYEECPAVKITVKLDHALSIASQVRLNYSGTVVDDMIDSSGGALPTSVTVPAGNNQFEIFCKADNVSLNGGSFIVEALGCTGNASHTFTVYTKISATPIVVAACGNDASGSITFAIEGGSQAAEMSLYNNINWQAITDGPLDDLTAGIYEIMVQDHNSCHFELFTIEVLASPAIAEVIADDVMYEQCEGIITVVFAQTVSIATSVVLDYSGTAASDITTPDGAALPTIINVAAGTDRIEIPYKAETVSENGSTFIVNVIGCNAPVQHTFDVYTRVEAIPVITAACGETQSGKIAFEVSGGSPFVEMSLDGTNWQEILTNGIFEGLAQGNYTVQVRDLNSCYTETFNISIPKMPEVSEIISNNELFEGCEGILTISLDHTVNAETIIILNYSGLGAEYVTALDGGQLPETIIIPANTLSYDIPYAVIDGDVENKSQFIIAASFQACSQLLPVTNSFDVYSKVEAIPVITATCESESAGMITFELIGGSPNVEMSLDGIYWYKINDGALTGLAAGEYTVQVRDPNSCHTESFIVEVPVSPVISEIESIETLFEDCDGIITIRLSGSVAVATVINLDFTGNAVNDVTMPDGNPLPNQIVIPANTNEYEISYKVSDAVTQNGGALTLSASLANCNIVPVVKNFTIYSNVIVTPIVTSICGESSLGTISFDLDGGSPNVEMSIDNGTTWQLVSDGAFTGLTEGLYTVLIKDKNSCHTKTFEIEIVTRPIVREIVCNDEIYELCDGEFVIKLDNSLSIVSIIELNYSGIAAEYIKLSDGSALPSSVTIPAGTDEISINFKVEDVVVNMGDFIIEAIGCTAPVLHTSTVYSKIEVAADVKPSCYDAATGEISFTITGGSGNILISNDEGATWNIYTNEPLVNLSAGDYTILLKDGNSCHIETITTEVSIAPYILDMAVLYDGKPQEIEFQSLPEGTIAEITYTGIAPTVYESSRNAPTEPGSYAVSVVTYPDYGCSNNMNATLTIGEFFVNGESWFINDEYVICGKNYNELQAEIKGFGYVQVAVNGLVTDDRTFIIETYELGKISVSIIITPKNGAPRSYTFNVDKRFIYNEIGVMKWNNVLLVNNNPATNGGYTFVEFQWFKNGEMLINETGQYYTAGDQKGIVLDKESEYYVMLVTEDGNVVFTCPFKPTLKSGEISAYPNPVKSGQQIYISADIDSDMYKDAKIELYDMTGRFMGVYNCTGKVTTIPSPETSGTYIVRVRAGEIIEEIKIIALD